MLLPIIGCVAGFGLMHVDSESFLPYLGGLIFIINFMVLLVGWLGGII